MALHRGRSDLLESHLRRDPDLLRRTFGHEEIYPPEMGCHGEVLATHGTPLAGATLLHMAVDYDEMEIAHRPLDRGMDPNVRAAVDSEGFGGHKRSSPPSSRSHTTGSTSTAAPMARRTRGCLTTARIRTRGRR